MTKPATPVSFGVHGVIMVTLCMLAGAVIQAALRGEEPSGAPTLPVTALTDAARADFWQARYELERKAREQDNKIHEANAAILAAKLALVDIETLKLKLCPGAALKVNEKTSQPECVAMDKTAEEKLAK